MKDLLILCNYIFLLDLYTFACVCCIGKTENNFENHFQVRCHVLLWLCVIFVAGVFVMDGWSC